MNNHETKADHQLLRRALLYSLGGVVLLWLIFIVETVAGHRFAALGIFPRSLSGLPGIVFAPLLHGSFEHITSNTLPLLILGTAFLYTYPKSARFALPLIYLISGVLVWLFARQNIHIGASGVSYGMLFFLMIIGMIRRDRAAIGVSLIVFFLYGSLIWGVFPGMPGVSFESHLAGAMCGSILAILLRHYDPVRHHKHYDWENDDDGSEPSDFVTQLQQIKPTRSPTPDQDQL